MEFQMDDIVYMRVYEHYRHYKLKKIDIYFIFKYWHIDVNITNNYNQKYNIQ